MPPTRAVVHLLQSPHGNNGVPTVENTSSRPENTSPHAIAAEIPQRSWLIPRGSQPQVVRVRLEFFVLSPACKLGRLHGFPLMIKFIGKVIIPMICILSGTHLGLIIEVRPQSHRETPRVIQHRWMVALIAVFVPWVCFGGQRHAADGATADRPNVVLIMADDLSHVNLSVYGAKNFSTPHIDRLAEKVCASTTATPCLSVPLHASPS